MDVNDKYKKLRKKCKKIIGDCDTARVINVDGILFLIIGYYRSNKNDDGQIFWNNEPYDFMYVNEHVIASGNSKSELIKSVKRYKKESKMSVKDLLGW